MSILNQLENQELDFKLKADESLGKALCAFANTDGGIVILGVSKNRSVKGITQREEEKAANIAENCKPRVKFESKWENIDGNDVLAINVPKSNRIHTYKGVTYRRVGSSSMPMSVKEILGLSRQKGLLRFDEEICKEAGLEDIDEEKVRWFLRKARSERNFDVDPEVSIKEALERLSLIKNEKLTDAAILLFGKNPQKFFTQSEVRCARFKGTKALKPFIDMKVFGGSIIDQVDKALNFVLEHIPMAAWVIPGKVEREEKYAYPPEAVREAIINAICHRDYESPSNVQVRVFDDRIEIWNPGGLPEDWTVETLKREHESKPFNPLIANQFFLIKFIEKWGTGINDMIAECAEWNLPEPEFEFTGTSLVVTFRRSILTEESLRELGLNDRQIEIIKYLRKRESITSSEYVEMFGITGRQARMDISQLVSASLILKSGKARQTKYRFNPEISGNIRKLRMKKSGEET